MISPSQRTSRHATSSEAHRGNVGRVHIMDGVKQSQHMTCPPACNVRLPCVDSATHVPWRQLPADPWKKGQATVQHVPYWRHPCQDGRLVHVVGAVRRAWEGTGKCRYGRLSLHVTVFSLLHQQTCTLGNPVSPRPCTICRIKRRLALPYVACCLRTD